MIASNRMWSPRVTVMLNGEARDLADGATVGDLLGLLKLDPRYLAVELNRRVVPRAEHGRTPLCEGDQLEIVTLVGGG
jgi:thiamine biosynthesis protein ThiS